MQISQHLWICVPFSNKLTDWPETLGQSFYYKLIKHEIFLCKSLSAYSFYSWSKFGRVFMSHPVFGSFYGKLRHSAQGWHNDLKLQDKVFIKWRYIVAKFHANRFLRYWVTVDQSGDVFFGLEICCSTNLFFVCNVRFIRNLYCPIESVDTLATFVMQLLQTSRWFRRRRAVGFNRTTEGAICAVESNCPSSSKLSRSLQKLHDKCDEGIHTQWNRLQYEFIFVYKCMFHFVI